MPFFGKEICREGVQSDPKKLFMLNEAPPNVIINCNNF